YPIISIGNFCPAAKADRESFIRKSVHIHPLRQRCGKNISPGNYVVFERFLESGLWNICKSGKTEFPKQICKSSVRRCENCKRCVCIARQDSRKVWLIVARQRLNQY